MKKREDLKSGLLEDSKGDRIKPSDQEWRKKGPIVMHDGAVVSDIKVNVADCDEMKNNLVEKLKFMSKVTRGVYSGAYQNDKEYINFCDKMMDKFIEEEGESIAQQNMVEMTKIMSTKLISKKTALPTTTPVHLRSNPVVEEVIKIDLTDELNEEQKKEAIERIMKKDYENPKDDPVPCLCKSSDAGGSILKVLEKEFKKGQRVSDNLVGTGKNHSQILKEVNAQLKAQECPIKKKKTKKKVVKKAVKKKAVKKKSGRR